MLAFSLFTRGRELSSKDMFMWISIGIMYLVFFTPFFFSVLPIGTFSRKIPSVVIIWSGIFVYIPASVVVIGLLRFFVISLNVALVVQSIVLFAFLMAVYFGYFASSHAGNVAAEEKNTSRYLTEMKNMAASLALKAGSLSNDYEGIQKLIKQSADDIRYFSPVDQNRSTEIDFRILDVVGNLLEFCDTPAEGGHVVYFEREVKQLQVLIKERKLLRN